MLAVKCSQNIFIFKGMQRYNRYNRPKGPMIKMSFGLIPDYTAKAFQSMAQIMNKHKNNEDLFSLMTF